jgi:lysozyme family protein
MKSLVAFAALLLFACEPCTADVFAMQAERWQSATIPAQRVRTVDAIVNRIQSNRGRYEAVQRATGVPWHVTAALHNMEASGSFSKHLHEGSPLTGRTRYVPKGRPREGTPPFKWEVSAVDALRFDRMVAVQWDDIRRALQACEAYNGTGYQRFHTSVPTPYLWSHTNLYTRGKYVADGKWSSTAVSAQTGVAAIWKRMHARKLITLP